VEKNARRRLFENRNIPMVLGTSGGDFVSKNPSINIFFERLMKNKRICLKLVEKSLARDE